MTCVIENCDNRAVWKLYRHDDVLREVCTKCRDELLSVYLWTFVGRISG